MGTMANTSDITDWAGSFDVNSKPWLILGKGPSFSQIEAVDLSQYFVCTLNHTIREVSADLAHIIDIDVLIDCAEQIKKNAKCLAMPLYPHVNSSRTKKNLFEFANEIPVLAELNAENRLFYYDLRPDLPEKKIPPIKKRIYSRFFKNKKSPQKVPVIRGTYFSAEAAINLLAESGVKTIRSLGIDGGAEYSDRFDDLSETTLLANGRDSFDKQFPEIAKTIRKKGLLYAPLMVDAPVRVFVGTDAAQMAGVKVLEYSIRKYASISVEVQPIDDSLIPRPVHPSNRSRTGFSFSRFAIPAICGYKGRAIYMDADMLVFDDIIKLWNTPFGGADVLYSEFRGKDARVPQFSVMLLNCEQLQWRVEDIVRGLDKGQYDYKDLMQKLCVLPDDKKKAGIPYEWNSLEHFEVNKTCLIHYTDMPTQPWVCNSNPNGNLWYKALREAVDEGVITRSYLQKEIMKGHVSPKLLQWAGIDDPFKWVHWIQNFFWKPPYKRFTKKKRLKVF